jgi:hypothetical protein
MQGVRTFAIYFCRLHAEGGLFEDDPLASYAKTFGDISKKLCSSDNCVPSKLGLVKVSDNQATMDTISTTRVLQ